MGNPSREGVRLIVFAKLPVPGQVKTRLGESLGAAKAAALYKAWLPPFIEKLLELGDRVSIEVCVAPAGEGFVPGNETIEESKRWLSYPVGFTLQEGADLGDRLTRAFDRSFEAGWKKVFVLGSDSPHLTSKEIETNLELLDAYDVVLGPTEDGGYYAVGLSGPPGDLFDRIRWSSPNTLADTERAARRMGLSVGKGPISYDLDTLEDLTRLIRSEPERWSFLQEILGIPT